MIFELPDLFEESLFARVPSKSLKKLFTFTNVAFAGDCETLMPPMVLEHLNGSKVHIEVFAALA